MLKENLESLRRGFEELENFRVKEKIEEVGRVISVDNGIAKVTGLQSVRYQEIIRFENGERGIAFDLGREKIGVVILDPYSKIKGGDIVRRENRKLEIPVSDQFIGKVINPLGEILTDGELVKIEKFYPIEREAPGIMERSEVNRPLQTGIKVVDAIVPIGRGQRELILGDRQTGKTAIAIDTIINQRGKDVICIYCAIGQKNSSVVKVVDTLKRYGAMDYSIVMAAESSAPVGMNYIAPYAATALGEYFLDRGKDVLIVYDDLTKHARCYREISLLLERPPGREAYPGDIFYIHSRLLERSTQEKKGGSITAIPIAEIEGENISSYIPTNLISITDGQIYLSPKLFQRGEIPALKVGSSVSRVGGKTQLPAYREITKDLKLLYSQFEELEAFENLSTRLDENTKKILERGKRIRKILTQEENSPIDAAEQIGVLLGVTRGILDSVELEKIETAEHIIRELMGMDEKLKSEIEMGGILSEDQIEKFLERVQIAFNEKFGGVDGKSAEN